MEILTIAFVNPPHADWSLANNMAYLMFQSHYKRKGKYRDCVKWLPAPYKWNEYTTVEDVYSEIKEANIILFSSYIWNCSIVDEIASYVKKQNPLVITALGGPHIGTNQPPLLLKRLTLYDYICQPTKPGEVFVEDLINQWFEHYQNPNIEEISWAIGSDKQRKYLISEEDYSVYEDHLEYLTEMTEYAKNNKLEPFIIIETTRGCPYKCVYCEWGGGIQTKFDKKDIEIVKRDLLALKKAGFRDAYLTDSNFGVFEDRDIEIFRFAWQHNFALTDISTVKSKSLERRKRLVKAWFETVGPNPAINNKRNTERSNTNMWESTYLTSVIPTISIQSISDEAMKIANRVDLKGEDKLELGKFIYEQCQTYGYPKPGLELILAMPGSTITDFYNEMDIIWYFQAWGNYRHDYIFLPDSDLNSKEYKDKYNIKTVEVYSDIHDEDGIDNRNSLYKDKKTEYFTIRSCFSFSEEEMKEMWFMNLAGNYLLRYLYPGYKKFFKPSEFCQISFDIIKKIEDYYIIKTEIDDIFNPNTPARSIRRLNNIFRVDAVEQLLKNNELFIKSEVIKYV